MSTKNQNYTTSDFFCTQCGERGIPVPRKKGDQREAGHLKKMYCLKCQKKTNHAEVRPFGSYNYEDFKEEFELGRFVDGKRIPVADLISCGNISCKCNKSGKCWNAAQKHKCPKEEEA